MWHFAWHDVCFDASPLYRALRFDPAVSQSVAVVVSVVVLVVVAVFRHQNCWVHVWHAESREAILRVYPEPELGAWPEHGQNMGTDAFSADHFFSVWSQWIPDGRGSI